MRSPAVSSAWSISPRGGDPTNSSKPSLPYAPSLLAPTYLMGRPSTRLRWASPTSPSLQPDDRSHPPCAGAVGAVFDTLHPRRTHLRRFPYPPRRLASPFRCSVRIAPSSSPIPQGRRMPRRYPDLGGQPSTSATVMPICPTAPSPPPRQYLRRVHEPPRVRCPLRQIMKSTPSTPAPAESVPTMTSAPSKKASAPTSLYSTMISTSKGLHRRQTVLPKFWKFIEWNQYCSDIALIRPSGSNREGFFSFGM